MTERPYVLLSAAMSADGYLDDASSTRLVLSDEADLDRVDELRAASDAILVASIMPFHCGSMITTSTPVRSR